MDQKKPLTQKEAVMIALRQNGSITSWEAFTDWGITRLASIIYNLIHKDGIEIEKSDVTKTNRYGHKTTFTEYKLKSNQLNLFQHV